MKDFVNCKCKYTNYDFRNPGMHFVEEIIVSKIIFGLIKNEKLPLKWVE